MNDNLQTIIVAAIIAIAAIALIFKLRSGRNCDCCTKDDCPMRQRKRDTK